MQYEVQETFIRNMKSQYNDSKGISHYSQILDQRIMAFPRPDWWWAFKINALCFAVFLISALIGIAIMAEVAWDGFDKAPRWLAVVYGVGWFGAWAFFAVEVVRAQIRRGRNPDLLRLQEERRKLASDKPN
jgi:TRAP-type C4-dicarboxylate transport system permease small subunit